MIKMMYTVKEVAKILGRRDAFVRSKIKSGHLKAVTLGRTFRIEEESLQEFKKYCKEKENVEYSCCENIEGITIDEFCKTTNTGMSFARKLINKLEKDGTIRVFKVNNKRILPKDIFAKLGFSQNYYPESKVEPSTITDINTTRLFKDDTLSTNNHSKPLSTNITVSNKPNDTLNIIKEIQRLSGMLKSGEINKSEFSFLKKSPMLEA